MNLAPETEVDSSSRSRAGEQSGAVDAAPAVGEHFETSFGPVSVVRSPEDIPEDVRRNAFAGQAKDFRYYEVSGRTLSGQFDHRYLILKNTRTGESAVQPVFFANQDILEGVPAKVHSILTWPRKFFPRWLCLRMLVVGCSAGDGALDSSEPWAVTALHEALAAYAKKSKAAMILLKDFPASYRPALNPFAESDYRRVPSMPACALALDFASFEDFMKNKLGRKLRYKYIKLNKREPIAWEVLTDVTPIAEELYALYKQTHERSKMKFERLTPEFFAQVGQEMPDTARYFVWRVEGRIAAFALCLVHGEEIHHLNIGFDYTVSLDLQLYYVTMRDILTWALGQGLKRYVTGQLNYDPKLHLKMRLAPLDLYARHTSALLNPIFKYALEYLQPVRHDPTLQQFENVQEL
jgi:hypothetical protein